MVLSPDHHGDPSHQSSKKSLTSDNILPPCIATGNQTNFIDKYLPVGLLDLFYIWMFLPGSHSDPEASAELWWERSHLTWEQPIRGTGGGAGGGGSKRRGTSRARG